MAASSRIFRGSASFQLAAFLCVFLLSCFPDSLSATPFPFSFWKSSVSPTPTPTATATATPTATATATPTATAIATPTPTPTPSPTPTATATATATPTATPTASPTTTYTGTWVSNGDANGIFYFAGQNWNTGGTWTNPHTAGRINVTASSLLSGTVDLIVDRATSDTYTTNAANSYYVFNLGANKSLALTDWTYRSRSGVTTSTPTAMSLEGSNDNSTWTAIDSHTLSVTSAGQWFHWSATSAGYRYFRLKQTAVTSSGDNYFTIGEFELYGTLTYSLPASPMTMTYSSNGDENGVVYFIGTNFGTNAAFRNPHTAAWLTSVRSSNGAGTATDLVNRAAEITYSTNVANSWIAVDLGASHSMVPNKYSLQIQNAADPRAIRNWKLQGTNSAASDSVADLAAATWTDIDTRVADTTMANTAATWVTYTISGSPSGYRYFRILQNGLNGGGTPDNYLALCEWELYGTFTY
jgi:hypothetical protein